MSQWIVRVRSHIVYSVLIVVAWRSRLVLVSYHTNVSIFVIILHFQPNMNAASEQWNKCTLCFLRISCLNIQCCSVCMLHVCLCVYVCMLSSWKILCCSHIHGVGMVLYLSQHFLTHLNIYTYINMSIIHYHKLLCVCVSSFSSLPFYSLLYFYCFKQLFPSLFLVLFF